MMKLTSLKNRKLRNRNRAGRLGQRTRSRLLRFESLEVRALLAATVINVDTFDDVVHAGDSVTSLREAIIQANSTAGDFQINLTAGTYALTIAGADEDSAATGDLDILNNGSVAIVGAGAELTVIDGSNLGDRIFHVGAGASLDLSAVTVTAGGDTSVTAGGLANSGTLVLTNAAVTNNINLGIYNNGVATISGSAISGHVGGSGGAAILNVAGDLTVINSTISNNEATSHAGAGIHTLGNTAVNDRVSIIDSIISDNTGAGLRTSSTTIASITGTTITRNNSPGTAGGISGAVRQMTIENSIISDNTGQSGGIVVNGDLTIANSTISGNTAWSAGGFGGGLYVTSNAAVALVSGSVIANNTGFRGAGVTNSSNLTIVDSEISNNVATGPKSWEGDGGGIYNFRAKLTISGSTISGNTAQSVGGAVYSRESSGYPSSVTITDTTITNNTSPSHAVELKGGTNSIFGSNVSNNSGGGIGLYGGASGFDSTLAVTDSLISGNIAAARTRSGGGVYNTGGSVAITGSTISNNSSTNSGGAIFNASGSMAITSSSLSNNSSGTGGGISNSNAGSVEITDSTLANNSAGSGGGIFNAGSGSLVTIARSTLAGNSANKGGSSGGGIYNYRSGSVEITSSTLSGNLAKRWGGGIFSSDEGSSLVVSNSTFTGNRADVDEAGIAKGGGMWVDNESLAVLHHTIVAGNLLGSGTISHDISGRVSRDSSFNLVGDPATAGLLSHGYKGNILGDGNGNPIPVASILDTVLADNGGPSLTHALILGSPAIDAGDPDFDALNLPYDQRGEGFERVVGGRIDIGAYEAEISNSPPVTHAGGPYTITVGESLTLDASGSSDPDGDPLTFAWDLTGNGAFTDAMGGSPTLSWEALVALGIVGPGNYDVAVLVDDGADFDIAATTLTILHATPTITIDWTGGTYNGNEFVSTGSVLGFDGSEIATPTFTYFVGVATTGTPLATAPKDADSYTVLAEFAGDSLHTPASASATIVINQRSITVTADDQTKAYGDADPALTYGITSGSLVATDAFFGELAREAGEDVGSYAIQQGSLGLSDNYDLSFVEAELEITHAILSGEATTQDALNTAKQGMLDITVTNIEGFVNGENAEVFLTSASFWITIGDVKYEFEPTSVTQLSDSSIAISYRLKNSDLQEDLAAALDEATSGATALEAGFAMQSTNYSLSDDYLTRLFSTVK